MTSRWDDDSPQSGFYEAVKTAIIFAFLLLAWALGYFNGSRGGPPAPVAEPQVDTVHVLPTPDFIEAFRLQCYWIPREEESNEDQTGG
jgi:hypothetical protein